MGDKPESKSVMLVGNSTALSTVSSQTDKCLPTKPSVAATTPSTPFSPKPVPVNTSHEPFLSISNQPSLTKSEPEPTDNSSTQNNLSPEKKMLLTTTPEVTTPSVKKSLTWFSTESENSPINVPVFKVSSSSTPSVVVPDPDSPLC